MNWPRLFTVEEANRTIEQISPVMARIQKCALRIECEMEKIAKKTGIAPTALTPNQLAEISPPLRMLFEELDRAVAEIEGHGCYFKGLRLGLVDFPALIDGQEVFLCWQYGEAEVFFWHPLDAGFGGRRLLSGRDHRHRLH